MQYSIETSADGTKLGSKAFDASKNTTGACSRRDNFSATGVRFLKLNILRSAKSRLWPSLWELRLYGTDGNQAYPSSPAWIRNNNKPAPLPKDYKKSGNYPPHPHRLSAAQEAELLKDVTVPEGFTVKPVLLHGRWPTTPLMWPPPPNGDLYVSSDGNGSVGRDPGRGRVLRPARHRQ